MEDQAHGLDLRWDAVVSQPAPPTHAGSDDAAPGAAAASQTEPDALLQLPAAHAASVTGAVLAAVVGRLEVADVEHFFVDRARSGSRVAVPKPALAGAEVTLRQLGEEAALHVRVDRGKRSWTGLLRDLPEGAFEGPLAYVLVYAEVLEPASGLRMGTSQGCRIEPWTEDEHGGLQAVDYNPRTQEVTAHDRAHPTLVDVGDRYVTTVPPFDLPDVFEVERPVDAVILWVDGDDPDWRAARDRRRRDLGLPPHDPGTAERLYADHGELRYLLRSIERYAPWLRHLYLVTAGQQPHWLRTDHPWLTLVDHRDIIEDSALPTFSPRPITARMHRIEGLSEHFLYFNDDMVLARSISPRTFFTSNGLARFFLSDTTVPRHPSDEPHLGARQVMQELIRRQYRVGVSRTFRHAPYAMTRSTLAVMERHFGTELDATVHRPFRTTQDIIPEWLHHYVAYLEGAALPGKISYGYFPIGLRRGLEGLSELLTVRNRDCFCLNDFGDEVSVAEAEAHLADVLPRLLPGAGSFEADGGGGEGR